MYAVIVTNLIHNILTRKIYSNDYIKKQVAVKNKKSTMSSDKKLAESGTAESPNQKEGVD